MPRKRGNLTMLFTIAIILVALWALGLVSGTTIGGFVHVLLVIAIVVIAIQLLSGRRVV
jgi:fatty acid desaturase